MIAGRRRQRMEVGLDAADVARISENDSNLHFHSECSAYAEME